MQRRIEIQERSGERPRYLWEDDPYKKEYPFEYLKYEVDRKEKIATVTLNDPTGRDIAPHWFCYPGITLIRQWERDDDVKVVIIKSAGKNFLTGVDLGEHLESALKERAGGAVARLSAREGIFMARDLFLLYAKLLGSAKPTIAQVHGKCFNDGLTLQRVCDMTIASDDAEFGQDFEHAVGIRNEMIPIGRHHPLERLKHEMAVCGRVFTGRQLAEMGIINRAIPQKKLDEEVWNDAKKIALHSMPELVRYKMVKGQEHIGSGALIPGRGRENPRHEPGEFSFLYVVREHSISEATRQRNALYAPLGGFGIAGEIDLVVEKNPGKKV